MVVMQEQVSEKTEDKPEGRFQYSLEPRSHSQRIRQRHVRRQSVLARFGSYPS